MDQERPRGQNNETRSTSAAKLGRGGRASVCIVLRRRRHGAREVALEVPVHRPPFFLGTKRQSPVLTGRGLDTNGSLARGGKSIWRGSGQESGKKLGEWQPTLKT